MTLHNDRVTCDVPGCEASVRRTRMPLDAPSDYGWSAIWMDSIETCDICPACRARYTDEQLRDMLARKEAT